MNINNLKPLVSEEVVSQIPGPWGVMEKFGINTPLRLGHFLAQCAHESGMFRVKVENLNYSEAGLKKTFAKYFPGDLAKQYARKPEKIANRVYANRMGNGPEESGDGFRYRGRGFIQLTGKNNYTAFNELVEEDILKTPELVASKYPLLSAAWFWNSRNINKIADKGKTTVVITEVTKLVNGGTHGLEDRISKFNQFYAKLT